MTGNPADESAAAIVEALQKDMTIQPIDIETPNEAEETFEEILAERSFKNQEAKIYQKPQTFKGLTLLSRSPGNFCAFCSSTSKSNVTWILSVWG
jgi:hypothetical protein